MEKNLDRKWRMQQLISKQKLKHKKEYGVLFEECMNVLGNEVSILSKVDGEEAYDCLQKTYPFSPWSRIDWEHVSSKMVVDNAKELEKYLSKEFDESDENVFILWSYGDFPVLKTQLQKALEVIDDLRAVSSDIFILSPSRFVIECYHEGEITIGFRN
ncbi:hypothetical protein HZF08_04035 [Paenibacillus sp. CGMCC 1.16610]|uniref:DUF1788 domain-containing protein n=1 Tax=Paenibacillus anseongense TaxID=2682845 RepID=A0ABW9UDR3_9BACL|nr:MULTISPECIES: hypothetical protein [Paenibacillus]MBA2937462.1 hypothetical protein [Paenibacillus sp. CGMCC 1.16610]MVQ36520.1 hypothetical protein [Paenibacillus anseongense]